MTLKQSFRFLAVLLFVVISDQAAAAGRTLADMVLSGIISPTDEVGHREDIMAAVENSLRNKRYDELETLANTFRGQKLRTPSGRWRLSLFYGGLRRYQERLPENQDPPVGEWLAAYPSSPAAHIGYATMLVEKAWKIRGKGYASTVDEEDWTPFRETVERARQYLLQYKSVAAIDPNWYATMAEVGTIQGWSDADYDALLREAFDREPTYTDTYFEAANRDLPKWGGNAEKVEKLAREAEERTRTTDGSGLYTRIYWSDYGDDLFTASAVDWAEMKRGMDDILARYPTQWNISHFAYFACLAGDYTKALEMMDRIEYQPMTEIWGGLFSYYRCKLWAELLG
ncbi:MAG TPA: hypothetical protein VFZ03_05065 [Dongiaceae bacterium]